MGLSVSRVGGAAQTKAMKKAAGSIRIDLAQYREMEVFTQFSSDLDDITKEQLTYGKGLMELLKQPLGQPLSMEEQVVTLCAASHKVFIPVPVEKIKGFQEALLLWMHQNHPEIFAQLRETRSLSEELLAEIVKQAEDFRDTYLTENK